MGNSRMGNSKCKRKYINATWEKYLLQIFRIVFILWLQFLVKIAPKTECMWKKCKLCSVSSKYNCVNATYKVKAAHFEGKKFPGGNRMGSTSLKQSKCCHVRSHFHTVLIPQRVQQLPVIFAYWYCFHNCRLLATSANTRLTYFVKSALDAPSRPPRRGKHPLSWFQSLRTWGDALHVQPLAVMRAVVVCHSGRKYPFSLWLT